jgi:NAD(P)-dependent dehydrogenase (short-subunit alcohol dehydrogenase family)
MLHLINELVSSKEVLKWARTRTGSRLSRVQPTASVRPSVVREGGSVVVTDVDEGRVTQLAGELGERCVGMAADVTAKADMGTMVEVAVGTFGGLDVGFNVAGTTRVGSLLNMTDEIWDFTFDICLKGVLYSMLSAARQMITAGTEGAIVNVASLNSEVPMFGGSAYFTAKAGVAMLSRCAALEFAEHGIRVNTISPGLVDTRATQFVLENDLARDALTQRIPMGRAASTDEIANAALLLGGPQATYVSGSNLFVDGAWAQTAYPDLRPATLNARA